MVNISFKHLKSYINDNVIYFIKCRSNPVDLDLYIVISTFFGNRDSLT